LIGKKATKNKTRVKTEIADSGRRIVIKSHKKLILTKFRQLKRKRTKSSPETIARRSKEIDEVEAKRV